MSWKASGIRIGSKVNAESTTDSNRLTKPEINSSLFSEIEFASWTTRSPIRERSCGATETTTGMSALKTSSTIVKIRGKYVSTSSTARGANCSMMAPIWSTSPPAPARAPEKSPIRSTRSPLASVSKGKRT